MEKGRWHSWHSDSVLIGYLSPVSQVNWIWLISKLVFLTSNYCSMSAFWLGWLEWQGIVIWQFEVAGNCDFHLFFTEWRFFELITIDAFVSKTHSVNGVLACVEAKFFQIFMTVNKENYVIHITCDIAGQVRNQLRSTRRNFVTNFVSKQSSLDVIELIQ